VNKTQRKCEVLIVGCGTSGICAAVSAARLGANVLLIEKNSYLGGAAVTAFHRFICGLYVNSSGKPKTTLNEGMPREIHNRLRAFQPSKRITRIGQVNVLPFATRGIISVYKSLLSRTENIETLYNTRVISVKMDKGSIGSVKAQSQKRAYTIRPKVVIDCSGSGAIVRQSGAGYQVAPLARLQLSGFSFKVKKLRRDDALAIKVPYYIKQAVARNKLPTHLKFTTFTYGKGASNGVIKLSMPPTNGMHSPARAKRDARIVHKYLALHVSSFKESLLTEMLSEVLDREGPRVRGEYTLKTEEVLNAHKFNDGVTKNAWPIEIWDQKKGPQYRYLTPGDYYEIPARCLKAKDIKNLYCAGRCISVSHEALGSTRVMGPCMSLGEAAGIAAARHVKHLNNVLSKRAPL